MVTIEDSLFKPLPTRRAFQEIADQISNLIYANKLKPGDKLPTERELAMQFGAGRLSVREAFRVLEQAGLIFIKQGVDGGAFVKEVDASVVSDSLTNLIRRANISLDHYIAVRIGLEELIIKSAINNITKEVLRNLKKSIHETAQIIAEYESGTQTLDTNSLVMLGAEFHLELARATGNPLFEIMQESLVKAMRIFLKNRQYDSGFQHRHLKLHKSIYEALEKKDLQLALQYMNEHSQRMLNYLS